MVRKSSATSIPSCRGSADDIPVFRHDAGNGTVAAQHRGASRGRGYHRRFSGRAAARARARRFNRACPPVLHCGRRGEPADAVARDVHGSVPVDGLRAAAPCAPAGDVRYVRHGRWRSDRRGGLRDRRRPQSLGAVERHHHVMGGRKNHGCLCRGLGAGALRFEVGRREAGDGTQCRDGARSEFEA